MITIDFKDMDDPFYGWSSWHEKGEFKCELQAIKAIEEHPYTYYTNDGLRLEHKRIIEQTYEGTEKVWDALGVPKWRFRLVGEPEPEPIDWSVGALK